jgi:predicted XRE-type DNA-binding protein
MLKMKMRTVMTLSSANQHMTKMRKANSQKKVSTLTQISRVAMKSLVRKDLTGMSLKRLPRMMIESF